MSCSITSSSRQPCKKRVCTNACCTSRSQYFTGSRTLLQDLSCGSNCDAPLTIETWQGEPEDPGSTEISSVPLNLCDKIQFWSEGSVNINATPGSAKVQFEVDTEPIISSATSAATINVIAALPPVAIPQTIFCGSIDPQDDNIQTAPSINGVFHNHISNTLWVLDKECGITGWKQVNNDFWTDSGLNLPNEINQNDVIYRYNDIRIGTDGNMTVGNNGNATDTIVGVNAMLSGGTGERVAIGYNAGAIQQNKTVAIGCNAGQMQQTGSIAIGYQAGTSLQYENDIAIGKNAGGLRTKNSISLGCNANARKSNQLAINLSGQLDYDGITGISGISGITGITGLTGSLYTFFEIIKIPPGPDPDNLAMVRTASSSSGIIVSDFLVVKIGGKIYRLLASEITNPPHDLQPIIEF